MNRLIFESTYLSQFVYFFLHQIEIGIFLVENYIFSNRGKKNPETIKKYVFQRKYI